MYSVPLNRQTASKKKNLFNDDICLKLLYRITNSMDMNLSKLWETVQDRGAWGAVVSPWECRVRRDLVTEQQQLHLYFLFWQEQKGEASNLELTTNNSIYC